jgi:hypothetical protein
LVDEKNIILRLQKSENFCNHKNIFATELKIKLMNLLRLFSNNGSELSNEVLKLIFLQKVIKFLQAIKIGGKDETRSIQIPLLN